MEEEHSKIDTRIRTWSGIVHTRNQNTTTRASTIQDVDVTDVKHQQFRTLI